MLGLGGRLIHGNSDERILALEVEYLRQVVLALGPEPSEMPSEMQRT